MELLSVDRTSGRLNTRVIKESNGRFFKGLLSFKLNSVETGDPMAYSGIIQPFHSLPS